MENNELLEQLTTQERLLVSSEVSNKRKSPAVVWILWLLLGMIGAHRYYFKKIGTGVLMTAIFILSFGMLFFVNLIWMIVDAFKLNREINADQAKIEKEVAEHIINTRNEFKSSPEVAKEPIKSVDTTQEEIGINASESPVADNVITEENEPTSSSSTLKQDIVTSFSFSNTTASVETPNFTVTPEESETVVNKIFDDLKDFVVLDIETTGRSADQDGITQVSGIKYVNDEPIETFNEFVNPEHDIPRDIQFMTHITPEMVADKPTFTELLPKLSDFIGDNTIIGHNVSFDIKFLRLHGYHPAVITTEDTLSISRRKIKNIENHKLETLKNYYGLKNQSHNSLNDCETTAFIYREIRDGHLDQVVIASTEETPGTLFADLRFCITGKFMEMDRDEIKELITKNGGRVTGAVSSRTDYLIVGEQVANNLTDGIHSASELKAMEFSEKGGKIKVLHSIEELQSLISEVA
ncbi:Putative phage DNA polymerase III alpha subunit [Paucilactobacillus oligofermentans DSM 15707 = LMG 22743]|uniref:exonuclease domain-containing protein n=1 Tax=Paucilactobacillus oligofermentans TaxID=293371 RepID=UPI00078DE5DE|nr:exonuclease domain-containing protein [Paucilactobacillus oligofermentans]CUS26102.1 Putative phage DNA polymerase III alpha subunit [Paucilactobacillus oligofermentans DSM 15707 = LMG 22743]